MRQFLCFMSHCSFMTIIAHLTKSQYFLSSRLKSKDTGVRRNRGEERIFHVRKSLQQLIRGIDNNKCRREKQEKGARRARKTDRDRENAVREQDIPSICCFIWGLTYDVNLHFIQFPRHTYTQLGCFYFSSSVASTYLQTEKKKICCC